MHVSEFGFSQDGTYQEDYSNTPVSCSLLNQFLSHSIMTAITQISSTDTLYQLPYIKAQSRNRYKPVKQVKGVDRSLQWRHIVWTVWSLMYITYCPRYSILLSIHYITPTSSTVRVRRVTVWIMSTVPYQLGGWCLCLSGVIPEVVVQYLVQYLLPEENVVLALRWYGLCLNDQLKPTQSNFVPRW